MGSEETAATCMSDEKGETSNTVRNASGTRRHVAWRKEMKHSLDCHVLSDTTVFCPATPTRESDEQGIYYAKASGPSRREMDTY